MYQPSVCDGASVVYVQPEVVAVGARKDLYAVPVLFRCYFGECLLVGNMVTNCWLMLLKLCQLFFFSMNFEINKYIVISQGN